jgi:hypothetical protein
MTGCPKAPPFANAGSLNPSGSGLFGSRSLKAQSRCRSLPDEPDYRAPAASDRTPVIQMGHQHHIPSLQYLRWPSDLLNVHTLGVWLALTGTPPSQARCPDLRMTVRSAGGRSHREAEPASITWCHDLKAARISARRGCIRFAIALSMLASRKQSLPETSQTSRAYEPIRKSRASWPGCGRSLMTSTSERAAQTAARESGSLKRSALPSLNVAAPVALMRLLNQTS